MSALAFLDESGDTSFDLEAGASQFYTVGLVVFLDNEEAARCSAQILQLRDQLGKSARYEFHFRDNRHIDRLAFLATVANFNFTYHAVIFKKLHNWPTPNLALTACVQVCEAANLQRTLLVLDGTPGRRRNRRFISAIRNAVNQTTGIRALDGVQVQDSARTPLLQLADYVAGVMSRDAQALPGGARYRQLLHSRERTYWRGDA